METVLSLNFMLADLEVGVIASAAMWLGTSIRESDRHVPFGAPDLSPLGEARPSVRAACSKLTLQWPP